MKETDYLTIQQAAAKILDEFNHAMKSKEIAKIALEKLRIQS